MPVSKEKLPKGVAAEIPSTTGFSSEGINKPSSAFCPLLWDHIGKSLWTTNLSFREKRIVHINKVTI